MNDKFSRVNIPHTLEWCKFNDNSKAALFRKMFVDKYGGEFKHNGKWHQWLPPTDITVESPSKLIHPNQGQVHFSHKEELPQEPKVEYDPADAFKSRTTLEKKSEIKEKSLYIITDPEGNETKIENFSKFCRDHNLNKSAMYEVARGKRKHHKKYTCRKKEY